MTAVALFIRHRTRPGMRDEVRRVWERHMRPAIERNPGHAAYYYCFDDGDADSICAFQHYADATSAREFLDTESYAAYLKDVEPLLAGPPQVASLVPVWIKKV